MNDALLKQLADLIEARNTACTAITKLIGRPAQTGHVGEFIASEIFDIQLETSAVNKGFDGRFRSGPLVGRTVDVKFYARREASIDLRVRDLPDFYLIMTGPQKHVMHSRGDDRLWFVDEVFLFDAPILIAAIAKRGTKIGDACSVPQQFWAAPQIYPPRSGSPLVLTPEQLTALSRFHSPLQPTSAAAPFAFQDGDILEPTITEEEMNRREELGGGRPLADILADLERRS